MSHVITRFTVEELQRLNQLPPITRPQALDAGPMAVAEARFLAGMGWVSMTRKRWPDPTIWDDCVSAGCDLAFHYADHRWYYRHGAEAICAVNDLEDTDLTTWEEQEELTEWLTACHEGDAR